MKANKVTSCLVILLVLAVLADNTIANNLNSVQKNEASTDQTATEAKVAEIVVNINKCLERCEPQDSICPAQCVLNEITTQKVLMEELISGDRKVAQGIFCMVGCESSQLCHDVNTLERAKHCFSACHKYCYQKIE